MPASRETELDPVVVDYDDLDEAMQSANAWASELRARAARTRESSSTGEPDVRRYEAAADRIDAAVGRLRRDAELSKRTLPTSSF